MEKNPFLVEYLLRMKRKKEGYLSKSFGLLLGSREMDEQFLFPNCSFLLAKIHFSLEIPVD
jgi:hypothetical protein